MERRASGRPSDRRLLIRAVQGILDALTIIADVYHTGKRRLPLAARNNVRPELQYTPRLEGLHGQAPILLYLTIFPGCDTMTVDFPAEKGTYQIEQASGWSALIPHHDRQHFVCWA